jgi:hypothetical protein
MVRPAMQEEPGGRLKEVLRSYIQHRCEGLSPVAVP